MPQQVEEPGVPNLFGLFSKQGLLARRFVSHFIRGPPKLTLGRPICRISLVEMSASDPTRVSTVPQTGRADFSSCFLPIVAMDYITSYQEIAKTKQ
jgi:hypothetical protein